MNTSYSKTRSNTEDILDILSLPVVGLFNAAIMRLIDFAFA